MRPLPLLIALFFSVFVQLSLPAQTTGWKRLIAEGSGSAPATANDPGRRMGHCTAWDQVSNKTILFGGWSDSGTTIDGTNSTYTYDHATNTWLRINTGVTPLEQGTMASFISTTNSGRGSTVLHFGGKQYGSWTYNNVLRYWTGSTWQTVSTTGGPPSGRLHTSLVQMPCSNDLFMYGGANGNVGTNMLSDLWRLSYTPAVAPSISTCVWQLITQTNTITALTQHSMTWDYANSRFHLTGGNDLSGWPNGIAVWTTQANTWTLNGVVTGTTMPGWTVLTNPTARLTYWPGGRNGVSLVNEKIYFDHGLATRKTIIPWPGLITYMAEWPKTATAYSTTAGTQNVVTGGGTTKPCVYMGSASGFGLYTGAFPNPLPGYMGMLCYGGQFLDTVPPPPNPTIVHTGETWVYHPPAFHNADGNGCGMTMTATNESVIGANQTWNLVNPIPANPTTGYYWTGIYYYGTSYHITGTGTPGCFFGNSYELSGLVGVTWNGTEPGGIKTGSFAIPNNVAFLGVTYYAQSMCNVTGAPGGVMFSDTLAHTISAY